MFIFHDVLLSFCANVISFADLIFVRRLVYSHGSLVKVLIFVALLHRFLLSSCAMTDIINHRGIEEHDVRIILEPLAKGAVADFDINEDEALVGVVFNDSILLPFFL